MDSKKSKKADLTKKTGFFFSIGLVLAFSFIITGFEWKNYDNSALVYQGDITENLDEILDIPITDQPPPEPPKIQQPKLMEVPDEEIIDDMPEIEFPDIQPEDVITEIVVSDEPIEEVAEEIFTIVEEPAMPIGGHKAFYKFVQDNMKYPTQARRMGVEGRVFVQFVIDKDGSIIDVAAIKGIGAGCDEEAVRVVRSHPNWKPPKQRGQAVKQRIVLPITFRLN